MNTVSLCVTNGCKRTIAILITTIATSRSDLNSKIPNYIHRYINTRYNIIFLAKCKGFCGLQPISVQQSSLEHSKHDYAVMIRPLENLQSFFPHSVTMLTKSVGGSRDYHGWKIILGESCYHEFVHYSCLWVARRKCIARSRPYSRIIALSCLPLHWSDWLSTLISLKLASIYMHYLLGARDYR